MRKIARQTVITVTYLCVVLMLMTPVGACIYCCNCGEVRPRNPYVLLNSTLNLTCRINSSLTDHASNLFFVLNDSHRIPDEFIHIIDNKTIQFSKTVTSLNESGTYVCRRRDLEGHESIVDQQLVELEYPLRNVTNFRCEVHDWDVNKTCTWDIGEYVDKRNINVTLLGFNGVVHLCQIQTQTSCIWPSPVGSEKRIVINAGRSWNYIITLQNVHTKQNFSSLLFGQEVNEMVRPAPVRNVQATNSIDRDCVTLHWKYPRPNRPQSARIQYFSERSSARTVLLDHRESNCTMCNLTAYTNYTFLIQIRPQTESGNLTGHWSAPVSITHRTRLYYPSQAPIISSGCYLNNHEQCQKKNAYRNVKVFWKSIAESEINGDNIYYKINCQEISGNQHTVSNITKPKMIAEVELKCDKAYSVKIYTGNEFGLSEHYGSLMIPPAGTVERPTNVFVGIDDKIVNISWTYTGKELANFTIFWCSKMRLNKEVSWQKVGCNKRFLVMDLHKFKDIDDLKYGVSADLLDRNISSGFEWKFCKFRINEAPAPPIKVSILSEVDGLLINWIPPNCDEKSSKPVKYQLTWCPTDPNAHVCQGQNNSIIIDEKDHIDYTYHITKVELSQTYGITINSISQRNMMSVPTAMVYGKPSLSKMRPGEIAGITLGSMVVLVMVIAGIVFILRNCCAKIKDLIHPPPIVVPYVPTSTNHAEGPATIYYGNNYESYVSQTPEIKYTPLNNPAHTNGGVGGKSFQFQFSMDSGRGSLPVDDLIPNTPDPETRSQPSSPTEVFSGVSTQSITVQENLTVNCVMKSDLSLVANESTAGTSSHPLSAYHAISQHSMSDLSTDSLEMSDEDSGLSDKSEDGDIKPYVKAGTKNNELDSGGKIHEQLINSMRNQDAVSTDIPSWEQDNCSLDLYIENKFRDTNDIVLTLSVSDEATDVNNSLLTQALQITDVNDILLTQAPQDQTSELNDILLTQASGDETAHDLSLIQSSNDVTNQQISDLSEHLGDVDQISLHSHEFSVVTSSHLHPCDLSAKAPQDILELPKLECVNILDEKKEEHCDEYQLRFDEMCNDSSNDSSLSESDIESQSERMAQQDTSHLDYVSIDFNTYSCESSNYSQNNYTESCAVFS